MPATSHSKHLKAFFISGVFLIVVLGLGVVMWLSQQSQDVRQQAAVDGGLVVVSQQESRTAVGQPSETLLSLNTQGLQISGVQLSFQMTGPLVTPPTVELVDPKNFQFSYKSIEPIASGYQVKLIVIAKNVGQPISTAQAQQFLRVMYQANQISTVSFIFDNSTSKVNQFQTGPVVDQLLTMAPFSVSIQPSPTPTSTPTPTPSFTPTPTPTNTPTPTPSFTPTPRPTPTPTPTPTFTPTPRPTPTPTFTPTPTPSFTPTPTPTPRPTNTPTPTPSFTPTPRPTNTPTPTPSNTPTPTPSPTATPTPTPSFHEADINRDGYVDLGDYTIMAAHFLQSGTYEQGDITGDGEINLADYTIWVSGIWL